MVRRCLRPEPERRYASAEALKRALKRRRLPLQVLLAMALAALLAWPFFHQPTVVEVPVAVESDSLRQVVDSLQGVITQREEEDAALGAALNAAKARVESVYQRAVPVFRRALREAQSTQEVIDAWLALNEELKEVNFDIPAGAPEPIRPVRRDYMRDRNNTLLPTLNAEMAARLRELTTGQP
jgi:hypothetical protein